MNTRIGTGLLLALLLGLVACAGTPEKKPLQNAQQRQVVQAARFSQAKTLFAEKRYAEAAALLLPLAKQGHLEAQYSIGYMYHYGLGLPRNEKEAIRWITLAAARGHPQAKEALARINAVEEQQGILVEPGGKAQ